MGVLWYVKIYFSGFDDTVYSTIYNNSKWTSKNFEVKYYGVILAKKNIIMT
jgi:hypothetical protein